MPPSAPNRMILSGRIVTMDAQDTVVPRGAIYVENDRVVAVRPASAEPPVGFEETPRVDTRGTIFPGLIELHNHLSYNALRLWQVPKIYHNRDQWGRAAAYSRQITGPMSVLGRYPGLLPAIVRYVECKCLVAGVTTSQGIALFSNMGARRYYRGIVRNVEATDHAELPEADTRIADVDARDARRFLDRLEKSTALLLHLSEGTDEAARKHFLALHLEDGSWAIRPSLAGIHAAGLSAKDFEVMAAHGGSIVWSPLSNLLLYGRTTRVDAAVEHGVKIGLGSDWSVSGSKNLLGELKVARLVSREMGGVLRDIDIVSMATRGAAAILKWDSLLGTLTEGRLADLLVLRGSTGDPYAMLLDARETDVHLVTIDGKPRFGVPSLMRRLGSTGEPIRIGGKERVFDLAQDNADPVVGKISFAEARGRLTDALSNLPKLARDLEEGKVEPALMGLGPAPGMAEPRWFLALDELVETGMALRPRLPGADGGPPTGPTLEAFLPAMPISEIVEPLELDRLTVADDGGFLDRLEAQANLPDYVRSGIRGAYSGVHT